MHLTGRRGPPDSFVVEMRGVKCGGLGMEMSRSFDNVRGMRKRPFPRRNAIPWEEGSCAGAVVENVFLIAYYPISYCYS